MRIAWRCFSSGEPILWFLRGGVWEASHPYPEIPILYFFPLQSRVIVQQPGERSFHSFYQVGIPLSEQITLFMFPRQIGKRQSFHSLMSFAKDSLVVTSWVILVSLFFLKRPVLGKELVFSTLQSHINTSVNLKGG